MGTTFIAVCDERREYIDPGQLGRGGNKSTPCILGKLAPLVMHKITSRDWPSVRMVGDGGDESFEMERSPDWHDVTLGSIVDFNNTFTDPLDQIAFAPEPLILVARRAVEERGILAGDTLNVHPWPPERQRVVDRLCRIFTEPRQRIEEIVLRSLEQGAELPLSVRRGAFLTPRPEQSEALVTGYAIGYAAGLKKTTEWLSSVDLQAIRKHLIELFYP